MRSTIMIVTLISLVPAVLGGQTLPGLPQFEVASIKPADPAILQKSVNLRGGELKATSYSLKNLIQLGWDVRSFQVLGGPDWVDSDKYNVDAKPPAPLEIFRGEGQRQFRLMVQALLADRFKLTLHPETKEMRVYFLVVGRNGFFGRPGSGLKRTADAVGPGTSMRDGKGRLTATQIDMRMLAHDLGGELGVAVIDKTNLDGAFDITLEWNPDEDASAPASGSSPSIFTAIQEQLGLKLDVGKGPVEILRVDRAERPSEN
jgi:uncharacterized protein (TIGR03435 family)